MIEVYSTHITKIIRLFGFLKLGYTIHKQNKSKGISFIFGILDTEMQIVIARRGKDGKDNEETEGPRAFA